VGLLEAASLILHAGCLLGATSEELLRLRRRDGPHTEVVELHGVAETVGDQFDRLVDLERD
jgi:hypothetical protein